MKIKIINHPNRENHKKIIEKIHIKKNVKTTIKNKKKSVLIIKIRKIRIYQTRLVKKKIKLPMKKIEIIIKMKKMKLKFSKDERKTFYR